MAPIEVYANREGFACPMLKMKLAIGLHNHVRRDNDGNPTILKDGFDLTYIKEPIARGRLHLKWIGFFDVKHLDDFELLREAHKQYKLDIIVWIEESTCLAHTRDTALEWSKRCVGEGIFLLDGDSIKLWQFHKDSHKLLVPEIGALDPGSTTVRTLKNHIKEAIRKDLACLSLRECRKNLHDRRDKPDEYFSSKGTSRSGANAWNTKLLRDLEIRPYARGTKFGMSYSEDYLAIADVLGYGNLWERNQFIGVEAHRASHRDPTKNARDLVFAMAATPHRKRLMLSIYGSELSVVGSMRAIAQGVMDVKTKYNVVVLDPTIHKEELFEAVISYDGSLKGALNADRTV